jgi:nucleoside-diphosphate-sugar epimerase
MKKVLILGSTGFIGSHVTAHLLKAGFDVISASRSPIFSKRKFPSLKSVKVDLNDLSQTNLKAILEVVDVVINISGLLNTSKSNDIFNVHLNGPKTILKSCVDSGVRRFINVSALGIDQATDLEYSKSKLAFEEHLKSQKKIDWVNLRPSLIYGEGCYGGTSLLRSLSSLPIFIPLIGKGEQQFQPLHIKDLCEIIEFCISYKKTIKKSFDVVGPQTISIKNILISLRGALGLPKAWLLHLPKQFIKFLCKTGDLFGDSPLSSSSFRMLEKPNTGKYKPIVDFTKIKPIGFSLGIETTPLSVQSLWHARLYFLKPILFLVFALFWIISGVIPLMGGDTSLAVSLIEGAGVPESLSLNVLYLMCVFDIFLGIGVLIKRIRKSILWLQFIITIVYTITLSIFSPTLLMDPLGSLLKNIPVLLLVLCLISIEEER